MYREICLYYRIIGLYLRKSRFLSLIASVILVYLTYHGFFNSFTRSLAKRNYTKYTPNTNSNNPKPEFESYQNQSPKIEIVHTIGTIDLPLINTEIIKSHLNSVNFSPNLKLISHECEDWNKKIESVRKDLGTVSLILVGNCFDNSLYFSFEGIFKYFDKIAVSLNTIKVELLQSTSSHTLAIEPTILVAWITPRPFLYSGQFHISSDWLSLKTHLITSFLKKEANLIVIDLEQLHVLNPNNYYKSTHEFEKMWMRILASKRFMTSFMQDLHLQIDNSFKSATQNKYRNISNQNFNLETICPAILNSRKYLPRCIPRPKNLYPLLITALGGAGTHSVARQLQSLGLLIEHESISIHGSVCWYYAVNDVLVSAKLYYPLDARLKSRSILSPRFEKVYSVVRHPLNHISSFTSHLKTSYQFIKQYMVFSNYSNIFDWKIFSYINFDNCARGHSCNLPFSALSWIFWNQHISSYSDQTFRIEDQVPDLITTISSLNLSTKSRYLFPLLSKKVKPVKVESTNHKKHTEYKLVDISKIMGKDLTEKIRKLGIMYGYNL